MTSPSLKPLSGKSSGHSNKLHCGSGKSPRLPHLIVREGKAAGPDEGGASLLSRQSLQHQQHSLKGLRSGLETGCKGEKEGTDIPMCMEGRRAEQNSSCSAGTHV